MSAEERPLEFSVIDDQVIIGTNACCRAHFEEALLARGVTGDISLEGEGVDHPFGIDEYLWIPTPDHEAPERKKVEVGIAALRAMLANGQKVYIHCKNGHGRAPTFYAAFLIRERGMTADAAIAMIRERRPTIHLEAVQLEFLRTLEDE